MKPLPDKDCSRKALLDKELRVGFYWWVLVVPGNGLVVLGGDCVAYMLPDCAILRVSEKLGNRLPA